MSSHIAIWEKITEARSALNPAVRIDRERLAMEGDIEEANMFLGEALEALEGGDLVNAKTAVLEALDRLRSDESRIIAENIGLLESAIRSLEDIAGP
jgi:cob(I)alamin adenosyltransferase